MGSRAARRLALAGVCAAFAISYALVLDDLPHNIDEGANLLLARAVAGGARPYADFFYHQFPLHLYLYAGLAHLAPDSVFLHRLVSLVATLAAGLVVYALAARLLAPWAAVAATALFYFAPIQHHAVLAMPNGLMMLCTLLGVWCIATRSGPRADALGGAALVLAVLLKPLAISAVAAVGLVLLLRGDSRARLPRVAAVVAAGGLVAWGALHLLSGGTFTELLLLQAQRFAAGSEFRPLESFGGVAEATSQGAVSSALRWNWHTHVSAFTSALGPLLSANFLLLLAAAGGAASLVRRRPPPDARPGFALLLAWLAIAFLFSLFVWHPAWDHYHLQYFPALAILAGLLLERLAAAGRAARAAAVAFAGAVCLLGVASVRGHLADYTALRALDLGPGPVLAMDPFLNVLTRTEPACGLVDPMNQSVATFLRGRAEFRHFVVGTPELIDCLERSPGTPVLLSSIQPFSYFFIDRELYDFLATERADSLVFPREEDRTAFEWRFGESDDNPAVEGLWVVSLPSGNRGALRLADGRALAHCHGGAEVGRYRTRGDTFDLRLRLDARRPETRHRGRLEVPAGGGRAFRVVRPDGRALAFAPYDGDCEDVTW